MNSRLKIIYGISATVVALILVLDADARRGKRIQIAFGGSGLGDWEFPEKEAFVANDQYHGPIILRGSDSKPGDILDLPMPLHVGVGTTPFDRLWINENGYVALGTEQGSPPAFDSSLESIASFPGDIIAPFYANFATTNTPDDGCGAGSSGGECDVAYGVLSMTDPSDLGDLDIDYLRSFRVTWGAFKKDNSDAIVDSFGLPEEGSISGSLNRVQMHLIDRRDEFSEGDFDLRFYYQGDIDWESQATHIGFKLDDFILDFSKFYNNGRTHSGFLGEDVDCPEIVDEDNVDAHFDPEQKYPCNIVKVTFRDGEPELVGYTSDLSLLLNGPTDPVNATDIFSVDISASNVGPEDESGVHAILNLPPGTSYVGVTPASLNCTEVGSQLDCLIGDLAANAVPIVATIELSSTTDGSISYLASIEGDRFDPQPINSVAETSVSIASTADIAIRSCLASTSSLNPGDNVDVTCTIDNNGPQDATGAVLQMLLPAQLSFSSSSDCVDNDVSLDCDISTIVSGASVTVSARLQASELGAASVLLVVSEGLEIDLNPDNNAEEVSLTVNSVPPDPNPIRTVQSTGGGGSLGIVGLLILAIFCLNEWHGQVHRTRRISGSCREFGMALHTFQLRG